MAGFTVRVLTLPAMSRPLAPAPDLPNTDANAAVQHACHTRAAALPPRTPQPRRRGCRVLRCLAGARWEGWGL
jgi:hypothetical protein